MAMTPDQKATLQLLLERGQAYGDLANLLGQDEAEVRARARAALTELGGADPDRHVGLTDYLLGQADPIGRADASRHLREDPADHELATDLSLKLRVLFPAAELPRLPGEPRSGGLLRRKPAKAADQASESAAPHAARLSGLSHSQTRLIVILSSAAILLLAIVLGLTGAFSGGDGGATAGVTTSTGADGSTTTTGTSADQQLQRVPLAPVSGGNASGEAVFGLATGDQPFIDVSLTGLDPAPNGKTYVIWLMLTNTQGYPISPIAMDQNGSYQNRFPIPSAVLPVVARITHVDVSIAPVKKIQSVVRDAIKNTALVIDEPGEVVLQGQIPKASGQGQGGSGTGSGGN
jgi:hypothetical protein